MILTMMVNAPPGSPKRELLLRFAVWLLRVKYWGWGGIRDAFAIVYKDGTIQTEFTLGFATMTTGLWWLLMPKPSPHFTAGSVFAYIDKALELPTGGPLLGVLWAMFMIGCGRYQVHTLAHGSKAARCLAARLVFVCWFVLECNQLLFNWRGIATLWFGFAMLRAYYIHENTCTPGRSKPLHRGIAGGLACPCCHDGVGTESGRDPGSGA